MTKVIYTAEAHVDGGRMHGHGRTSDGVLEVDIRPPGGEEQGVNPEQLFAIGYAACFESALSVVARRKKLEIGDVAIDSEVDLQTTDDRGFELAVRLNVTLPALQDADEAADLITTAHRVCPYSRATRGNIDVDFIVNGAPVAEPAAT